MSNGIFSDQDLKLLNKEPLSLDILFNNKLEGIKTFWDSFLSNSSPSEDKKLFNLIIETKVTWKTLDLRTCLERLLSFLMIEFESVLIMVDILTSDEYLIAPEGENLKDQVLEFRSIKLPLPIYPTSYAEKIVEVREKINKTLETIDINIIVEDKVKTSIELIDKSFKLLIMDFEATNYLPKQNIQPTLSQYSRLLTGIAIIVGIDKELILRRNNWICGRYDLLIPLQGKENEELVFHLCINGLDLNIKQKEFFAQKIKEVMDEKITIPSEDFEKEIKSNIEFGLENGNSPQIIKSFNYYKEELERKNIITFLDDNYRLRYGILSLLWKNYLSLNPTGSIKVKMSLYGPKLCFQKDDGNFNDEEHYHQSTEIGSNHPIVKYSDYGIEKAVYEPVKSEEITLNPQSRSIQLKDAANTFLNDILVFEEESDIFFVIGENYKNDYYSWVQNRREEIRVKKEIDYLYPLIANNDFIAKIEELQQLGQTIVEETTKLKDAILTLQKPDYDYPRVKNAVKTMYSQSKEREFTRNEILDTWIDSLRKSGEVRSSSHLKKNILSQRLTNIIKKIENGDIVDPEITLVKIKTRGRSNIKIKWNGN